MARRVNDYTADLVAKQPDRFGHFATLPLCRNLSTRCEPMG
jgi:6-methylsalicylate decarboxylase